MKYTLIRSARKTVAIQITAQGQVLLRCPRRLPEAEAVRFLEAKAGWIGKKLEAMAAQPRLPVLTAQELEALKTRLRPVLSERLTYYGPRVGVSWGRVSLRCQRSRWGSCSGRGNLNFNCLLGLAPPEVLDYVVVHELCHRKEMNHSPRFWAEVEAVLPEYRRARQWLKENGSSLLGRLPA